MNSGSSQNVSELLEAAGEDGVLSPDTLEVLNIPDLGEQIQAGLGVSPDDIDSSEVVLVTIMPDDSGSIGFVVGNTEAVRDGHNAVLDALDASKQGDGILVHTLLLNGAVICPFSPLDSAVRLDSMNYNPGLGTPLYDQTAVLLVTVVAKAQEFMEQGVPCRTVTLIISDGADEHSRRQTADSVQRIVRDMLLSENHIIAAMGIDDGHTDFRRVFEEMGIPPQWILTPGNTPSEIRAAFQVFSQSAVRASQGASSFSKTAASGGFGN